MALSKTNWKFKWPIIIVFFALCMYNFHWFYRPALQRLAYWYFHSPDGAPFIKYAPGVPSTSVKQWIKETEELGFAAATRKHRAGMSEYASNISDSLRTRVHAAMFGLDPNWMADELNTAAAEEQEGDMDAARSRYGTILYNAFSSGKPWKLIIWQLFGVGLGDVKMQIPADWPESVKTPEKRAYVLIFYGNKVKYILEMALLIRSIRKYDTETPAIILCTPDVTEASRSTLRGYGYEIRDMAPKLLSATGNLNFPTGFAKRLAGEANKCHQGNFRKLFLWTVTDFDKVILLDGDEIMLKDTKRLFACPADFCAAGEAEPGNYHINTGVMVIRPSMDTFNDLLKELETYDGPLTYSEQSYLSWYFLEKHMDRTIVLDPAYNYCMPNDIDPREQETGGVAIYHYCSNVFWCFECMPKYSKWGIKGRYDAGAEIREFYNDMTVCGKYEDEQSCSAQPGCAYCGHQILPCMAKEHIHLCHRDMDTLDAPVPFIVMAMTLALLL